MRPHAVHDQDKTGRHISPSQILLTAKNDKIKSWALKKYPESHKCETPEERFLVHDQILLHAKDTVKIATRFPKELFATDSPLVGALKKFLDNKGHITVITDQLSFKRDGLESFAILKEYAQLPQYDGRITVAIAQERPYLGSSPLSFMINDNNMQVSQIGSSNQRGYSFNDPKMCKNLDTSFTKTLLNKSTHTLDLIENKEDYTAKKIAYEAQFPQPFLKRLKNILHS